METNCQKKVLSNTINGKVIKCLTCNSYQIEYKNLHFTFSKEEFIHFRNYFFELDADYWEYKNKDSLYRRKIMVPVGHKNVSAMLNKKEIDNVVFNLKSVFLLILQKFNK